MTGSLLTSNLIEGFEKVEKCKINVLWLFSALGMCLILMRFQDRFCTIVVKELGTESQEPLNIQVSKLADYLRTSGTDLKKGDVEEEKTKAPCTIM